MNMTENTPRSRRPETAAGQTSFSNGDTHPNRNKSPEDKGCLGAVCDLWQQEWTVSEACADRCVCRGHARGRER